MVRLPISIALLFPLNALAAGYPALDATCDGFPKVAVVTMPGTCVGLIIQRSAATPFGKPRKLAQVPGRDAFLLTDMGSWSPQRGRLWVIRRSGASYVAATIRDRLNLPHQIVVGPDGRFYVGEAHRIVAFRLDRDLRIVDWRPVVTNLPPSTGNLHPLTSFIFLGNGDLLVNVGAPSDQCVHDLSLGACRERAGHALLRRYRFRPGSNRWSPDFEVHATGLRNSIALVRHVSGTVLQAENGMDFKPAEEPYEEINVIRPRRDYGWPYCYNVDAAHPDWDRRDFCQGSSYSRPWTLMPPHTAPLDMIYYTGSAIPPLKGRLLVGWHGYRVMGNRLVAYVIDGRGRPRRTGTATYRSNPLPGAAGFSQRAYSPTGRRDLVSQHVEVVSRWNEVPGRRPKGAPVGLLQAGDGSVWIVDDRNRAVLRLAKGEPWRDPSDSAPAEIPELVADPALTLKVARLVRRRCRACHGFLDGATGVDAVHAMGAQGWLGLPVGDSKVARVVTLNSMPPGDPMSEGERQLLQRWLATVRPSS